jgi:hypothetical protein
MKRTLSPHRIASLMVSILLALVTTAVQADIPVGEQTALHNLYASTNGASWTNNTNWRNGAGTECTWFGVTCDAGGTTVTGINLSINKLTGTLPARLLNTLPNLVTFYVAGNQLTGAIPALTDLTNLQTFHVDFNQLTGTIPALTGLTNLQIFYVNNNRLTGNVPSVPSPNILWAGWSSLCPNALNHTPDPAWDTATGVTPWYTNCHPLNLAPILELLLLD